MDGHLKPRHIHHYSHQVKRYLNFEIYVLNQQEYHDRRDDQTK
jgi:hypothetical protein